MQPPVTCVSIKERYRLNHPSSNKETFHIVLDIQNTSLDYSVGDCVGVYPTNHPLLVEKFLKKLSATGDETILDREGREFPLATYLTQRANLMRFKKSLSFASPQHFINDLLPLMPRFYSIASSMEEVGKEIHLTVARTEYELEGEKVFGTCSDFLCYRAPLSAVVIPIHIQRAKDFKLHESVQKKPIIMVGPGTGIAPFRGFIQERVKKEPHSKNWLFFGERNQATDFYYKEYLCRLVNAGHLRLDTAFSRDQEKKVYVQHKMLENASELWSWLNEGAFFYVCGDATKMAKEVEAALLQIIESQGHMSTVQAKDFVKRLRQEKRYLRDVY